MSLIRKRNLWTKEKWRKLVTAKGAWSSHFLCSEQQNVPHLMLYGILKTNDKIGGLSPSM
jgi:hypothetical protein